MSRPYFAYGSNMDPRQMAERCPSSTSLGAALLRGWRLTFTWDSSRWAGGVGNVVRDPADVVWGVLWDLTPEDEATLDRYEMVHEGIYTKELLEVERAGARVTALIYLNTHEDWRAPSKMYLGALLRGAVAHDLPQDYVARLEGVTPR